MSGRTVEPSAAFEIFRDPSGRWCARRADGLVGGTFLDRRDAILFARRECCDAMLFHPAAGPHEAHERGRRRKFPCR